jgi:hypothetical protein
VCRFPGVPKIPDEFPAVKAAVPELITDLRRYTPAA